MMEKGVTQNADASRGLGIETEMAIEEDDTDITDMTITLHPTQDRGLRTVGADGDQEAETADATAMIIDVARRSLIRGPEVANGIAQHGGGEIVGPARDHALLIGIEEKRDEIDEDLLLKLDVHSKRSYLATSRLCRLKASSNWLKTNMKRPDSLVQSVMTICG